MNDNTILFIIGALILLNIILLIIVFILRSNIKRVEEKQRGELILSSISIGGTRYDAFPDVSGKLSFSLAFVAGDEKGVILTSIHTREQSYLYLKPYNRDKSNLTEEEKKAIEVALEEGYTIKEL